MPKRRKAGPCALKVRNTISGAHSAKAYSASTGANSGYDMSATIEPTAVETASPEVSAAKTSTSTEMATSKSPSAEVAASKSSATKVAATAESSSSTAASKALTHCCE
jgi:hypothetical protein